MKQFTDDMKGKIFFLIEGFCVSELVFIDIEPKSNNKYGIFLKWTGRKPMRVHISQIGDGIVEDEKEALEEIEGRLKGELSYIQRRLKNIANKPIPIMEL